MYEESVILLYTEKTGRFEVIYVQKECLEFVELKH